MATRRQAEALLRYHAPRLLRIQRVVGVAVGRKRTAGHVRERGWCIRVHVTAKVRRPGDSSVPPVLRPPKGREYLGSIETDVVETGRTVLQGQVRPGFAVDIEVSGVVGCLLRDPLNQNYLLTAGHVAGGSLVVDELHNGGLPFGSQPEAHVTVPFSGERFFAGPCVQCSGQPPLDLALVLLTIGQAVPIAQISGIRDVRSTVDPLQPGELIEVLRANGRFTTQFHEDADADGMVTFFYPSPSGVGTVPVTYHEIVFYPRSGDGGVLSQGDSGSAVVDGQGRLIGIHIGASERKERGDTLLLGYAIPSHVVFRWARKLSLLTTAGTVSWPPSPLP